MQYFLGLLRRFFHELYHLFELGNGSISHDLVHEAFTAHDLDPCVSQPGQGYRDLLFIHTAYTICNDVHTVAIVEKIKGSLGDTDVRLDADNDTG